MNGGGLRACRPGSDAPSFAIPVNGGLGHFGCRRSPSMTLFGSPLPWRSRFPQKAMTAALDGGSPPCLFRPAVGVTFKRKRRIMTKTTKLTEADLRQFTGTEYWYRHGINRSVALHRRR